MAEAGRIGRQQPDDIHPRDEEVFSFAGLWECWHDPEGEVIESCSIITTSANDLMKRIHERMPVILGSSAEEQWLDPTSSTDALRSLLVPCPVEWMSAEPVSLRVNNPKNDDPKCIESVSA